jgi:hypothetical protein
MEAQVSDTKDPVVQNILHDPAADEARTEHEQAHDHATEVAHAWEHFHENWKFFAGFLSIILLTVFAFNVNFGTAPLKANMLGYDMNFGSWNLVVELLFAAIRCALIAVFLASLFKSFSFVFRTLCFTAIFLAGMIYLSLWDSEVLPGTVGDPIRLPPSMQDHTASPDSNNTVPK